MTDDSTQPLSIEGFIDGEVRGKSPTGRIVLPLLLTRFPTVWEVRASVGRDGVGHLQEDSRRLDYGIAESTDIASAVKFVRETLSVISSDARSLEREAAEAARARAEQSTTGADAVRAALREAGIGPTENDDGLGTLSRQW